MRRTQQLLLYTTLFAVFAIASVETAFAGSPKEATFDGDMSAVFHAAVRSAQKNWAVKFADEKQGIVTFSTGVSLTTWGMECSAILEQAGPGKIKVSLKSQKKAQVYAWGVGGRIANKFFDGVRAELQAAAPVTAAAEKTRNAP